MAAAQPDQINEEIEVKNLKYLDFVRSAAIQAVICFSSLYSYAKDNAGPVKSGVESVEGTVKTVVGPVVNKFHNVPLDLLAFADRKVEEAVNLLEHHVPERVKEVYASAQKAPEIVRSVAGEVQKAGVVGTAVGIARSVYGKYEPAAKEMYAKYEPVAERYAVTAWRSLNQMPVFPQVAQIVIPTAACWTEKYNQAVCYGAERGFTVSAYLPIVPTEKIAKVFASE